MVNFLFQFTIAKSVYIQRTLSDSKTILSGVSQGSILGPLLFVIYINDIPLFSLNTEDVIYADDVTLTTICDDVKRIESNLFIATKNALEWCKANDMVLSLPKCCSMIVASRQKLQNVDSTTELKIHDTVIPWVSTTKISGVHFDNALSWNVHIKHVYKNIVKNLYLLQ